MWRFRAPAQPESPDKDLADAAERPSTVPRRASTRALARSVRTGIDAHVPRQRLDQALDALVDCLIGLARDAAIADGTADPRVV